MYIGLVVLMAIHGLHVPITSVQVQLLPGSTFEVGLSETDVIVTQSQSGYITYYPLYTAILHGDTLTSDLLGSDHEVAITALGYDDQTPYELFVRIIILRPANHGTIRRGLTFGRSMTKSDFDDWMFSINQNSRLKHPGSHFIKVNPYLLHPVQ